jgi:hypothetical protein
VSGHSPLALTHRLPYFPRCYEHAPLCSGPKPASKPSRQKEIPSSRPWQAEASNKTESYEREGHEEENLKEAGIERVMPVTTSIPTSMTALRPTTPNSARPSRRWWGCHESNQENEAAESAIRDLIEFSLGGFHRNECPKSIGTRVLGRKLIA